MTKFAIPGVRRAIAWTTNLAFGRGSLFVPARANLVRLEEWMQYPAVCQRRFTRCSWRGDEVEPRLPRGHSTASSRGSSLGRFRLCFIFRGQDELITRRGSLVGGHANLSSSRPCDLDADLFDAARAEEVGCITLMTSPRHPAPASLARRTARRRAADIAPARAAQPSRSALPCGSGW